MGYFCFVSQIRFEYSNNTVQYSSKSWWGYMYICLFACKQYVISCFDKLKKITSIWKRNTDVCYRCRLFAFPSIPFPRNENTCNTVLFDNFGVPRDVCRLLLTFSHDIIMRCRSWEYWFQRCAEHRFLLTRRPTPSRRFPCINFLKNDPPPSSHLTHQFSDGPRSVSVDRRNIYLIV